jgi:Leucine-rich repeat (LRR) protein
MKLGNTLADFIFSNSSLDYLNLYQTDITFLNPRIEKLKNLSSLYIHGNQLIKFPNFLQNMTQLKEFTIDTNGKKIWLRNKLNS